MNKKVLRIGVWLGILAILAGIPVWLWSTILPLAGRFSPESNLWRSLGQLTGLLGMSFFAGSLLLSVRVKFIDRLFGGLNLVYRDHEWLGTIGFCLLLIHPLALAYRFSLQSLSAGANFLIPNPDNWPVFLGIVALFVLMALMVMTYWWRPRYHRWWLSHKFMALAYAIGWWHLLIIDSDVSINLALRSYYYVLGFLSVVVIIYRVIGYRFLVPRATYTIEKIIELEVGLWDIYLKPVGKPLNARAGQFAWFTFLNSSLPREAHPFSIAGSDAQGNLRVVIKALGDHTGHTGKLSRSDQVLAEGPYGSFGQTQDKKQLWIAGGIGITPFLSLAGNHADKESIVLIHTVAKTEQNFFAKDFPLQEVANLKFISWVSSLSGRLNAEAIVRQVPDWRERVILLCGPVPMMDNLRRQFKRLGAKQKQIISEDFNL